MRSLAVKIFLGFWLIHALIFVVLALLPGIGAYVWFFGAAILVQIALASLTALAAEAKALIRSCEPGSAI